MTVGLGCVESRTITRAGSVRAIARKPSRTRRWNSTCSPSKRSGARTPPRTRARVRSRPVSTGQSRQLVEQFQIETAAIALVGDGRVGIAVGDYDLARRERGLELFAHMLCAVGEHQQQLGRDVE